MTLDSDMAQVTGVRSADDMVARLYDDLRQAARRERRRAGKPLTLQTTVIIHEAYLRLSERDDWQNREHFLATAATAMRHVLIDAARASLSAKRGGGSRPLSLDVAPEAAPDEPDEQIVRLGEALEGLGRLDPELVRLVDCRFFAGMTEAETARVMGVSERTVRRRWEQARAWIHRDMQDGSGVASVN